MSMFSSGKKDDSRDPAREAIPAEVLNQVSVMGDAPTRDSAGSLAVEPKAPPVSSKAEPARPPAPPSPFLDPNTRPTPPSQPAPPANLPFSKDTIGSPSFDRTAAPSPSAAPGLPTPPLAPVLPAAKPSRHIPWMWILSVVILFILSGGVGYFLYTSHLNQEAAAPAPEETPSVEANTETPTPPEVPFALDQPNPLSLNTETSTPQSIQQELSERADAILRTQMVSPVEFLITDQNNNQLAFSRFAFLLGLSLDSDLLSTFDEPFALYLYNDGGVVRMALAVSLKASTSDPMAALANVEKSLPQGMQNLFYPATSLNLSDPVFATGDFNGSPVRYVNLDTATNYSFDYTAKGNVVVFGNSKNMVRTALPLVNFSSSAQ